MKTFLLGAGSDLGIHVDGTRYGAKRLLTDTASFYEGEKELIEQDPTILKSRSLADKRKNLVEINKLNKTLYDTTLSYLEKGYFPLLIGGDHTVSIPIALASQKKYENIGLIWFDSQSSYYTLQNVPTGNLHEVSLATINGYQCLELIPFHQAKPVASQNTVIIGVRNITKTERDNIRYSGATLFTLDDIKKYGKEAVLEQAFAIASQKTNGVHVSIDLDILSPEISPGVTAPEIDGINEEEVMDLLNTILLHQDVLVSMDIVEFNPINDPERKTEQIALNLMAKTLITMQKKEEKK